MNWFFLCQTSVLPERGLPVLLRPQLRTPLPSRRKTYVQLRNSCLFTFAPVDATVRPRAGAYKWADIRPSEAPVE